MFKATLTPLLLCAALLFSGCSSSNSGNTGRNVGVAAGAILGAVIGSQLGDGSGVNIAAGAAVGGALGGLGGSKYDKNKEELEAAGGAPITYNMKESFLNPEFFAAADSAYPWRSVLPAVDPL